MPNPCFHHIKTYPEHADGLLRVPGLGEGAHDGVEAAVVGRHPLGTHLGQQLTSTEGVAHAGTRVDRRRVAHLDEGGERGKERGG